MKMERPVFLPCHPERAAFAKRRIYVFGYLRNFQTFKLLEIVIPSETGVPGEPAFGSLGWPKRGILLATTELSFRAQREPSLSLSTGNPHFPETLSIVIPSNSRNLLLNLETLKL